MPEYLTYHFTGIDYVFIPGLMPQGIIYLLKAVYITDYYCKILYKAVSYMVICLLLL